MEAHKTKVHEYGEYYNLYPCSECEFMGGDAEEIKEHIRNHRDYRTIRSKPNMEKSYASFNISNGDIDVDGSDEDGIWGKNEKG